MENSLWFLNIIIFSIEVDVKEEVDTGNIDF